MRRVSLSLLDTADPMQLPMHYEDEKEEKKLQELKMEVNTRLVGPLLVLLDLLTTNRCKDMQKSGLYLSQTVMIHIRAIWTDSNFRTLERKSLEFCLMVMMTMVEEGSDNDSNELKRMSRKILHTYKTYSHVGGWKKHLSQTIVPTILELMEALPSFARSGRDIQVRYCLYLINGYLLISFRDFDCTSLEILRKSDIGHALSCSEAVEIVKRTFSGESL